MALSEKKVVKQVSIFPENGSVSVQWANQIFRDDVFVTETLERKAYIAEQKEEFLKEVDGAESYLPALGW